MTTKSPTSRTTPKKRPKLEETMARRINNASACLPLSRFFVNMMCIFLCIDNLSRTLCVQNRPKLIYIVGLHRLAVLFWYFE